MTKKKDFSLLESLDRASNRTEALNQHELRAIARHRKASATPWNGNPLYSDDRDRWYNNLDAAIEDISDRLFKNPQDREVWDEIQGDKKKIVDYACLYQSKPNILDAVDLDSDLDLPDGVDSIHKLLPADHPIAVALQKLNDEIEKAQFVISYFDIYEKPEF